MIDLALVKSHLRVDGADEDDLIQSYIDAALSTFENLTNRTLVDPANPLPEPVGSAIAMSKSIQQGALLLIGLWYSSRESVVVGATVTALPMATDALWIPHRWRNV